MSQIKLLVEMAGRCFDLASMAKNPAVAATLADIGRRYVTQARALRLAQIDVVDAAERGADDGAGNALFSDWVVPRCCG